MAEIEIQQPIISPFINYTTRPRQEFENNESDIKKGIETLRSLNEKYKKIMIIIGGSYWDYDSEYNNICKDIRYSLQKYSHKKKKN